MVKLKEKSEQKIGDSMKYFVVFFVIVGVLLINACVTQQPKKDLTPQQQEQADKVLDRKLKRLIFLKLL
ncbi:MAG: hypothetical protein GY928_11220 [Colwellia sp.]|nr:hypothetical protein [Colwellia sp.]